MMHGFGLMGYGWFFQLVILGLLILIFWWLLHGQKFGYGSQESPTEVVKRRYASGEITKKEYQQILKDL